jgi:hypothetical protein
MVCDLPTIPIGNTSVSDKKQIRMLDLYKYVYAKKWSCKANISLTQQGTLDFPNFNKYNAEKSINYETKNKIEEHEDRREQKIYSVLYDRLKYYASYETEAKNKDIVILPENEELHALPEWLDFEVISVTFGFSDEEAPINLWEYKYKTKGILNIDLLININLSKINTKTLLVDPSVTIESNLPSGAVFNSVSVEENAFEIKLNNEKSDFKGSASIRWSVDRERPL